MAKTTKKAPVVRKPAPKKVPAKGKAAKVTPTADPKGALPALAAKIEAALKDAKASTNGLASTLAKLAAGQLPDHAALAALRDGVNAAAFAARDHERLDDAKALARLNRNVRRLERAARKGGAK